MQVGNIDVNKLRGVADKGVGLGKELVGVLTGNERLQEAGEAQQERATAELKALRDELKAQGYDAKAEAMEKREKAAQRAK
ncbi:MAG: CsbD family protein [Acidimicrobiales bacterium]